LFWAFIGGCLGGIANYLRQKNQLLAIPFAISIFIAIGLAGYLYNDIQIENNYETDIENVLTVLAFNDLLEVEADSYLNNIARNSTEKISNLKEAQIRYQRMIEITKNAQLWNQKVLNSNPTSIRNEYSLAMSDYLNLKLNYYKKMEKGTELAIKGDRNGAKIQYNNAKKLLPQISKQKKLLDVIINKNPEFKLYIGQKIDGNKEFAQLEKQRNELLSYS